MHNSMTGWVLTDSFKANASRARCQRRDGAALGTVWDRPVVVHMDVDVRHSRPAIRLLGVRHTGVNEGLEISVPRHGSAWLDLAAIDVDAGAARLPPCAQFDLAEVSLSVLRVLASYRRNRRRFAKVRWTVLVQGARKRGVSCVKRRIRVQGQRGLAINR